MTEHLLATASVCHLISLVRFFQGLEYAMQFISWFFLTLFNLFVFTIQWTEAYKEPYQTSKLELSEKIKLKKLHLLKEILDRALNTPLLNIKLTACPCSLYVKVNYMLEIRLYLLPKCLLIFHPLGFCPEYNIAVCGNEFFENLCNG